MKNGEHTAAPAGEPDAMKSKPALERELAAAEALIAEITNIVRGGMAQPPAVIERAQLAPTLRAMLEQAKTLNTQNLQLRQVLKGLL